MDIWKQNGYQKLLVDLIDSFPKWDKLEGKSILISGASGMIGSFLVDAVMLRNKEITSSRQIRILALSRGELAAKRRFSHWLEDKNFRFFSHDITKPLIEFSERPELLIHAASTTHPVQYANEPINTILANILGTRNMLEVAAKTPESRFLLLSSVEIYGENRGDTTYFDEKYCGYIDCNTLRAGYPESKRVSEALCQAYIREKESDTVILRLPRCYGPTMNMNDTKALSQFIKKGIVHENIVLKSSGVQFYSYAFVADVVLGILWVLVSGICGEAYDLADGESNITLKELAALVAKIAESDVVFEHPNKVEQAGYSTATRAVMQGGKLKALGWHPVYSIQRGVQATIDILKSVN